MKLGRYDSPDETRRPADHKRTGDRAPAPSATPRSSACRCGHHKADHGRNFKGCRLCRCQGLSRWRPFAERIDLLMAQEAAGIRREDGEDDEPLALAHYAEYLFAPTREASRRYVDG